MALVKKQGRAGWINANAAAELMSSNPGAARDEPSISERDFGFAAFPRLRGHLHSKSRISGMADFR